MEQLAELATSVVLLAIAGAFLVVVVGIYFLPTIVAMKSNSRNGELAVIINFFFGWSIIGWVAAMVLASGPGNRRRRYGRGRSRRVRL